MEKFEVYISPGDVRRTRIVWLFFHILGGQLLLPILFATFVFSRAKRHPVLANMCVCWTISSIIASLLLYSGHPHFDHPELVAGNSMCVAQAALMQYAIPPMCGMAAFGLIYHVWTTVRRTAEMDLPKSLVWLRTMRTALLVTGPYFAFAIFGIAGSIVAASNPSLVSLERRKLYCAVDHSPLSTVTALFTGIVLLVTGYYEVRIIMTIRRNSAGQRDSMLENSVERAHIIRVAIFGVYVCVGIILAFSSVIFSSVAPDMFIATVAVVIFAVFGFQPDVLAVWCFWRRWSSPGQSIKGPRMKIEDDA